MNVSFQISRRLLNLYTRFSLYVIISVALIIVLIGYALLIGPKWTEISSVGLNDYKNEQQRLESDKEYLSALKQLVAKYETISQSRVDEIEEIIPTGSQLPALFVQMEALTIDAGMELQSITFDESGDTTDTSLGQVKTLNVSMQVQGGARYTDMKQLVDTIEKNIRILDLISISFTLDETEVVVAEDTTQGGTYQINMRTYYLDEAASAATGQPSDIDSILQNLQTQPTQ